MPQETKVPSFEALMLKGGQECGKLSRIPEEMPTDWESYRELSQITIISLRGIGKASEKHEERFHWWEYEARHLSGDELRQALQQGATGANEQGTVPAGHSRPDSESPSESQ